MESTSSTADRTRQERVLAAALGVFGRYGFRKTSMDEVARAAGISRQGLYLYFASKEALFRAAVCQELDCITEQGDPTLVGISSGCELKFQIMVEPKFC